MTAGHLIEQLERENRELRTFVEWVVDDTTVTVGKIVQAARHVLKSTSVPQTSADVEPEPWEPVSMYDLEAGDTIRLRVFDRQEGHVIERRTVVAVEGSKITLAEGGRIYDVPLDDDLQARNPHRLAKPGAEPVE